MATAISRNRSFLRLMPQAEILLLTSFLSI